MYVDHCLSICSSFQVQHTFNNNNIIVYDMHCKFALDLTWLLYIVGDIITTYTYTTNIISLDRKNNQQYVY